MKHEAAWTGSIVFESQSAQIPTNPGLESKIAYDD